LIIKNMLNDLARYESRFRYIVCTHGCITKLRDGWFKNIFEYLI
jgi:hypothetical protein